MSITHVWSVPPKWMHANRENLISWYLSIKEVDTVSYRTGRYCRNSSYRYRNTFKMYRSRYRPISDNTSRTGVYQTFRLKKRNSAGTKTKRKNRRNAWFEQTLVHQVATTLTSPIRSSSSFFFSSSRLLSFSIALISSLFLLNNEHCYAVSPSLFCAIWNFLSPFTRD